MIKRQEVDAMVVHIMDAISGGNHTTGYVNRHLFSPTEGYMVRGKSWSMLVHDDLLDTYTVRDYIEAHVQHLWNAVVYVDWGYDTEFDRWRIDLAQNLLNPEYAEALALQQHERTMFRVADGKTIWL